MCSTAMWLVVALSLAAASALPPPQSSGSHDQLAAAFVQAVASHDVASASQIYADISSQGHLEACAFTIAAAIKEALTSPTLDAERTRLLGSLRERLPTSVRNVVFASRVCLRNIQFNQYLYSPSDEYLFDADQRNVFTFVPGSNITGSTWILEDTAVPDQWKLLNVEHQEYLFASYDYHNNNRRRVMTSVAPWNELSTQNLWRLKTVGNDVYFQNVFFAGGFSTYDYLYVAESIYNFDANRRRLFTWDTTWSSATSHFFSVEAC